MIQTLLDHLTNRNRNITLMWAPGHAGIKGNERVAVSAEIVISELIDVTPVRTEDIRISTENI